MARISACSFLIEAGDLWKRRIRRSYFEQAPELVHDTLGERFACPGNPQATLPLESISWRGRPFTSSTAEQRVIDGREFGVRAEIVFPTFGWKLFQLTDPGLRAACMTAYNSWVCTLSFASPLRFFGAALITGNAEGRAELEHCGMMGLRVAVIAERDAPDIVDVASGLRMPVVIVPDGGATPVNDFRAFTRQSLDAANRLASRSPSTRFLVLSDGNDAASVDQDPAVTIVTPDADGTVLNGSLWGACGQAIPAGRPDTDERAMELFRIPDIADTVITDFRKARELVGMFV